MRRWLFVIIIVISLFILVKEGRVFSFLSIPDTQRLESLNSKIVVDKKAVVVLKEKIVFSPYSGKVEYFFKEGERVAKNALVAQIKTENGLFKFFSPESGIFSKRFDEIDLNDNLDEKEIESYLKSMRVLESKESSGRIEAGESIFRIVDNLDARVFVLKDDTLYNLIEDREIYIEDEIRGEEIPVYLKSISGNIVELSVKMHVEDFIDNKIPIIKIIAFRGKVIRIPKRFIKHNGVMVKDGENNIFVSLDNLFFVKENGYYIFPSIEKNMKLFKFLGKDIIRE